MSLDGRGCARDQLERPAAIFARPGRQSGAVEMDDAPAGMMSRAGVFVSALPTESDHESETETAGRLG